MTAYSYKRAIIIVLDSLGVGEMPDAINFGDAGTNTFLHVVQACGKLCLPTLESLGIGHLVPAPGINIVPNPKGSYGKMAEASSAKDTTTGHWEMMGIISKNPFPTYPKGFPEDIIKAFEKEIGRNILGNKPASGTEIIKEMGEEHVQTGCPIVYTSADSVFQVACHENIVPVSELYRICLIAREMLKYPHNVSRVIARPFLGASGNFVRTERRKDFSLPPPNKTLLDKAAASGFEVIGIGKIEDVFAGEGITKSYHTGNNNDGMAKTIELAKTDTGPAIIFVNLVDFDMLYGHRNDPVGYGRALERFDAGLATLIPFLNEEDLLFITADHGCDPTDISTDHTREYVPIIAYNKASLEGKNLGIRSTFADLGATIAEGLRISLSLPGNSFLKECFYMENTKYNY